MSSSFSLRSRFSVAALPTVPPLTHHPAPSIPMVWLVMKEDESLARNATRLPIFGVPRRLMLCCRAPSDCSLPGLGGSSRRPREGAGRYGVHVDVVRPTSRGEKVADDATLRGHVIEQERPPDEKGDRGHVHDVTPSPAPSCEDRQPARTEVAFEVDGHHPVPLLFFDLRPRAAGRRRRC